MSVYDEIKHQISFAVTGRQAIICPNCKQAATATTGRKIKANHQTARNVKTTCRHCHTSYSFVWK